MIADMLYTICVRQEAGYCGIEWTQSATTAPDPFTLDAAIAPNLALGGTATASDAYLLIPGSINSMNLLFLQGGEPKFIHYVFNTYGPHV